jgi:hypothetical protein
VAFGALNAPNATLGFLSNGSWLATSIGGRRVDANLML